MFCPGHYWGSPNSRVSEDKPNRFCPKYFFRVILILHPGQRRRSRGSRLHRNEQLREFRRGRSLSAGRNLPLLSSVAPPLRWPTSRKPMQPKAKRYTSKSVWGIYHFHRSIFLNFCYYA